VDLSLPDLTLFSADPFLPEARTMQIFEILWEGT
jgi:hypothetical protein